MNTSRFFLNKKRIALGILSAIFVFLLIVVSINTHIEGLTKSDIHEDISELVPADAVLILGASVYQDGRLTKILEDRVMTAIDVYARGKAPKILVSGDNGTDKYNEVVPIRKFLVEHGVPEEDIFVDFAGFSTYDSLYRAKEIFEVNSIIIVTQKFHLPRSIFIAKSRGISAQGISADKRHYSIQNHLRESLATIYTYFKVKTHTEPRFLGEKIPITGSGLESFPASPATTTAI